MSHLARRGVVVLCVFAALVSLGACARSQPAPRDVLVRDEALPTYDAVARAHNERVAKLDRVWARTTVVIDSTDAEGNVRRDQGEGHLHVIRPRSVALSVGKFGETGLYLGSNDERYWWFDLLGDREDDTAFVGRHDRAAETSLAEVGAPLHPLDLVELIGVLPLPEGEQVFGPTDRVSRGDDGSVLVVLPARSGHRLLAFEPETYRLRRAALFDASGRLLMRSEARGYGEVRLVEGGGDWPEMPDRLFVEVPAEGVSVSLRLYDAENRGSRQTQFPFELDRLLRAYRIERVIDIDAEAAAAAATR